MNIDKAIELNKESIQSLASHKFPDHADAVRLGNEALERVKAYKEAHVGLLGLMAASV